MLNFLWPSILFCKTSNPLSDHKYLGNEIIYQVVLDRFYDGNPDNNFFKADPSKGFYDETGSNMLARHGGDIDGLIKKLEYIASLGVTTIWVSPVFQNATELLKEDKGELEDALNSNYHGYWINDWYQVDDHLRNESEPGFEAVERLVKEADKWGLKIILDTVINHSNHYEKSLGRVYKRGELLTDVVQDSKIPDKNKRWYHHAGEIDHGRDTCGIDYLGCFLNKIGLSSSYDDWVYIKRLANLADFNIPENPAVMDYFVKAHLKLLELGVAGFRVDTILYLHPEAVAQFERRLRTQYPNVMLIGEWYSGGPRNVKSIERFYASEEPAMSYSMFNFDNRWVFEKGFVKDDNHGHRTFNFLLDAVSDANKRLEKKGFSVNDMVNFVDNHDLPRLRDIMKAEGFSKDDADHALEASIAMMYSMPGVPCLLYGIEQNLFEGSGRRGMGNAIGGDPFNRPMMFDKKGKLRSRDDLLAAQVAVLSEMRAVYPVFRYGETQNLDGQLKRTIERAVSISERFGFVSHCGRDQNFGFVREDENNFAFYITNVSEAYCNLEMNLNFDQETSLVSQGMIAPTSRQDYYISKEDEIRSIMDQIRYLKSEGLNADKTVEFTMAPFDYFVMIFEKSSPSFVFTD